MKRAPFLLFDVGGVLVENAGFERLAVLLAEIHTIEQLRDRWLRSTSVRQFELGTTGVDDFARSFIDEWRPRCSAETFITEFARFPKAFYPGARDLLVALRRKHRIGCLSNSNALHWSRYDGFEGVFDVALSSHLLGVIKPDAACFERAIEACDVERGEVLFFDDSRANVEAANDFGIRALQVEGFEQLRAALDREGLLA